MRQTPASVQTNQAATAESHWVPIVIPENPLRNHAPYPPEVAVWSAAVRSYARRAVRNRLDAAAIPTPAEMSPVAITKPLTKSSAITDVLCVSVAKPPCNFKTGSGILGTQQPDEKATPTARWGRKATGPTTCLRRLGGVSGLQPDKQVVGSPSRRTRKVRRFLLC